MERLAVHMRITGTQVSNEDVDTRRSAIADMLVDLAKGKPIEQSLARATEIAQALHENDAPAALGAEVQAAIQKHASAFLYEESPLEVGIVAGMAFVELAKPKTTPTAEWTTIEVLSASLWSALSYQSPLAEPKREALRAEVLKTAEDKACKSAEASRARSTVSDFVDLVVTAPAADATDTKITSNFRKATDATVAALRRNAALDREELDFLWWAQLGRSRILGKNLTSLAEPVRLVTSGIEAAKYLRRLPCDVHRDVVLKTLDKDPEMDLKKLLHALGGDGYKLGGSYAGGWVTKWPTVFPLLNALATGVADAPGHAIKRRASEWGARALLEAGMMQYFQNGAATL